MDSLDEFWNTDWPEGPADHSLYQPLDSEQTGSATFDFTATYWMKFNYLRWYALPLVASYKMLYQQIRFLHSAGTTDCESTTRLDEANCLFHRHQLGVRHISFLGI
jgi:hypothetical protein